MTHGRSGKEPEAVTDGRGRTPRVAVIGGGAGGIAMGVALRRLGIYDFTIFEQSDGVGGTWWDNTYPGAEVDIPVPLYSFSFHSFAFTRTHVKQRELLDYLESVVDRYHLRPHFSLKTRVNEVVWDEADHSYEVRFRDNELLRFDVVVSAVGILNHPKYPDWPGLESFAGAKFHSARWDHDVDIKGKRVAVVGTGSSSAQLVPAIAPVVDKLYVYQRQPGWILPKGDRDLTPAERARMLKPLHRRKLRLQQALVYERNHGSRIEGSKNNLKSQRAAEAFIEEVFSGHDDLKKAVTPDYPFGIKRPVQDSNFYRTLLEDHVELVPHEVVEVDANGIIDGAGVHREVDVLVMCTGFQPSNFLATFEVKGRNGQSIHEAWKGEPKAFLGLMVPGFPNFYMLYGPNTNAGSIMFMHERQVDFISIQLRRMIRHATTAIELRPSVMNLFDRIVQDRLNRNVVAKYPEVHFYGRAASGRNVIGWDEGMLPYAILCRFSPRICATATRLARRSKR